MKLLPYITDKTSRLNYKPLSHLIPAVSTMSLNATTLPASFSVHRCTTAPTTRSHTT
jgi:hypothetical protein